MTATQMPGSSSQSKTLHSTHQMPMITAPRLRQVTMRHGFAIALMLSASPAFATAWTPDQNTCNQQPTTVANMQCLERQTKIWDKRLNQAYQAVTAMLKATQNTAQAGDLVRAQRLWLQYRTANCNFYGDEDGTIREIDGAECMRRMTQDRALELQGAGPQ